MLAGPAQRRCIVRVPDGIAPRLVIASMIAGVTLIGWVARSTRAQDGPPTSATKPPAESAPPEPAPSPLQLPPKAEAPGSVSESPMPIAPPGQDAPAPTAAGPENDDPEKNARAFAERNRKEAQDELKKLKDEAERLRTRLGKVEAGIRRWEALLSALENNERTVTINAGLPPSIVPTAENPTHLDAIPKAKPATVIRESVPASSPAPLPR
jgi:hypothetical protein